MWHSVFTQTANVADCTFVSFSRSASPPLHCSQLLEPPPSSSSAFRLALSALSCCTHLSLHPTGSKSWVLGSGRRSPFTRVPLSLTHSHPHTRARQLTLTSFHFITFPLHTSGLNLSRHPKQSEKAVRIKGIPAQISSL